MGFSKTSFLKRFLMSGLLSAVLFGSVLFTTPTAHADVWGAAYGATLLDQVITTIKTQLKAALLGTLKVAATEVINSKVGQMIGGTTAGNARFVTDWNEFLYKKPAAEVELYMNDFFSKVTLGKNAQANYVGIGDTVKNVEGNYAAYLTKNASLSLGIEYDALDLKYDFDEYAASPDEMFAQGNFLALDSFFQNPMNNPFGFGLVAEQVYQKELEKKVEQIKVESQSSGYIAPKDKKGTTIAPVATLEAMQKDAMNIGNNIIAAATEPGEFLAGVVGAMVNKTITNIIQRGVGQIQSTIKKEIRAYDAKIVTELNQLNKELGPAAKYLKNVSQRTDTQIKPYTKAPPGARTPDNGVYCGGSC